MSRIYLSSLALVLVLAPVAAQDGSLAPGRVDDRSRRETHAASTAPAPPLAVPNARLPLPGLLTGGQPPAEEIEAAAGAGYRTVINLRGEGEEGFEWEPELVRKHGMRYVSVPIAGADGLTRENVKRVDAALDAGLAEGPVLLHCGSGNRVGAVLALRAAWLEGATPEEALALGKEAGLAGLEEQTRKLLRLAESPSPDR